MSEFRTIDDLPAESRLLVRVDLNSPIEDGRPQDNRRFERHAETVRELAGAGHAVVLLAHQGRPGRDDFTDLSGHADLLADYLDRPVEFVSDVAGDRALAAVRELDGGGVLLLDNVRGVDDELPEKPPEEHADSAFVRTLAPEFDAYVDDAYSAAHRSHASLVGFPLALPAYAGPALLAEYEANTAARTREFDGDVTMVLGGAKPADVIEVMEAVGDRVDRFLLGGVPGELFLRAQSRPVGVDVDESDRFERAWADSGALAGEVLDARGDVIDLPTDFAHETDDGERAEVALDDVDEKRRSFLDIGAETADSYADAVRDSSAVFVKGALGVFEDERFADGTVTVLEAVAETDCFSVVGGGDTSRAIERYGLDEADFSHVSIAGGAYIRALTGDPLPAIEVLRRESAD